MKSEWNIISKIALILFCISGFLFSNETVLLLIRHGQTDWNIDDRAQGHTNNPLNEKGLQQAKNLAEKIACCHSDIATIYSSDLDRAFVTAQTIAEGLNLQVKKRPQLRERNNGAAEGLTWEEEGVLYGDSEEALNQLYPYYRDRWEHTSIPGAETYNELLKRMVDALVEIAVNHPGEKIAVFAHGEIIGVFVADLLGEEKPIHLPNCSVTEIIYSPQNAGIPFKIRSLEKIPEKDSSSYNLKSSPK